LTGVEAVVEVALAKSLVLRTDRQPPMSGRDLVLGVGVERQPASVEVDTSSRHLCAVMRIEFAGPQAGMVAATVVFIGRGWTQRRQREGRCGSVLTANMPISLEAGLRADGTPRRRDPLEAGTSLIAVNWRPFKDERDGRTRRAGRDRAGRRHP
jgi:hypothetical protein